MAASTLAALSVLEMPPTKSRVMFSAASTEMREPPSCGKAALWKAARAAAAVSGAAYSTKAYVPPSVCTARSGPAAVKNAAISAARACFGRRATNTCGAGASGAARSEGRTRGRAREDSARAGSRGGV
jgi:hypothetical protein